MKFTAPIPDCLHICSFHNSSDISSFSMSINVFTGDKGSALMADTLKDLLRPPFLPALALLLHTSLYFS
nr:MAG TPA: hypothetical protein [Caudoviricetes sp.]